MTAAGAQTMITPIRSIVPGAAAELRGAAGTPDVQEFLRRLLIRYRAFTRDPLGPRDARCHGRPLHAGADRLPAGRRPGRPTLSPQRILAAKLGRARRT